MVVLVMFIALHYTLPVFITSGESMLGTINDGDILLGFRFDKDLRRGDIITGIQYSEGNGKQVIKRIIGLPGDHVIIKDNIVYVNGTELVEDYLYEEMNTADLDVIVPQGRVFVMGDNRNVSFDSRYTECVEVKSISSKVVFNLSDMSVCY